MELTNSAKNINYLNFTICFGTVFTLTFIFMPFLFNIINCLLFFVNHIFKLSLLITSNKINHHHIISINKKLKNDLPIYTILVPLYKEEYKVSDILKSIKNINYPKDKLDVKFILEKDDKLTIKTLLTLDIPKYISIIKVPVSFPRTKPKALNYAMPYIKGKYLTIYDAEDVPDVNQLLIAVENFEKLPKNFACLQAKLNFYNSNKNLLTKFFSFEYSVWFEYLLKGLNNYNLPIPLGGTSNHFKVSVLKKIKGWDAYNVTEDADLGIRLSKLGYKIQIIDSTTMEEATFNIYNWIKQRSRWIKGFIQTSLVFFKYRKDNKLNFYNTISVYLFITFSVYNFFIMPWIFFMLLLNFNKYILSLWVINGIISLSYMYVSVFLVWLKNKKTKLILDYLAFMLWPLYFILHSVACYIAIFELIKRPFYWSKTPHGDMLELEINNFKKLEFK